MIPLALQLYESRGGALIADFSDATSCQIDNGRHGFRSLTAFIPMPLELAFSYSEQSKGKWLSLNYGCGVAWEGRVEDPTVVIAEDGTGLGLTAFGAWRALLDVPYTALWSASGTAGWRTVTAEDRASSKSEMYQIDNNNRLQVGLTKNTAYTTTSYGRIGYIAPDGGGRRIVGIQFDFAVNYSSNHKITLYALAGGFGGTTSSMWTYTGTGSLVSGCIHATTALADCNALFFQVEGTGSATYTGESGDSYAKITNIRIVTRTTNRVNTTTTTTISAGSQAVTPASMTGIYLGQRLFIDSGSTPSESVVVTAVTASTFTATFVNAYSGTTTVQAHVIYADEIVSNLVASVSGKNPAQLSTSTALIESPGLDLLDESYEDELPGDIATKLAALGDSEDPPRLWEVGVWEGQKLHFRPKGSDTQMWAVDADELTVNSTLNLLYNSFYASYQDANNRTLRTAVADDATSQAQYGIVRRGVVSASTTSSTQAGKHRDAALNDGKTVKPRSQLQPDYLMDQVGAISPKWLARAGQTMNIRNLPPTLGSEVDRVRTFLLEENSYDPLEDALTPVPEEPPASLEFLVARRSEGV